MRSEPNLAIFKEPRGFIKILEIGIAIFAFATTAGYYSEFRVEWTLSQNKTCNTSHLLEKDNLEILAKFEYPFDEEVYYLSGKLTACCHKNHIEHDSLAGKFKSQSQFFVFTGVAAFLYCLVASAYYVLFEDQEQSMYSTDVGKFSFVVIDFVISVILVIFWFIASVAWATGLSDLKGETDPVSSHKIYSLCNITDGEHNLKTEKDANYATLKVSVILGFLNLFVWLGNLWFLFKETPWHNPRRGIPQDDSVQ